MSDWKSKYGVLDQGAYNAGVYGEPASMYDVARAQEESNKIRLAQAGYTPPSQPGYQPTFPSAYTPTYRPNSASSNYRGTPTAFGGASDSSVGGCLKVVAILTVFGCVVSTFPIWGTYLYGLAQRHQLIEGSVIPLDTAHYEALSASAASLSSQPTTRLYASRGITAATDWRLLSPAQRDVVAAAWIRYTRDPASFERLSPEQHRLVFRTFDGYLSALASNGDANAARDLERLAVRGK